MNKRYRLELTGEGVHDRDLVEYFGTGTKDFYGFIDHEDDIFISLRNDKDLSIERVQVSLNSACEGCWIFHAGKRYNIIHLEDETPEPLVVKEFTTNQRYRLELREGCEHDVELEEYFGTGTKDFYGFNHEDDLFISLRNDRDLSNKEVRDELQNDKEGCWIINDYRYDDYRYDIMLLEDDNLNTIDKLESKLEEVLILNNDLTQQCEDYKMKIDKLEAEGKFVQDLLERVLKIKRGEE